MEEKKERRVFRRAPIEASADIVESRMASIGRATIENIGVGGAFIRTDAEVKPGTVLSLLIHSDKLGGGILATARVIWVEPGKGVGVRFLEMESGDRLAIERYVAERAGVEGRFLADKVSS